MPTKFQLLPQAEPSDKVIADVNGTFNGGLQPALDIGDAFVDGGVGRPVAR